MIEWSIVRRASVSSTMDEINRLGEAGASSGTVVVADEQTDGRGRAGRSWTAPAGTGLFCSVLYRPRLSADQVSVLSLVAGLAVAEAVERVSGASCRLKWPNDVLGRGGKIAGILVATRLARNELRFANIGIGVNCTTLSQELPTGAASILTETGKSITPVDLLHIVLDRLAFRLDEFERASGRPSLDAWRERAAFLGEPVRVVDRGAEREGILAGIDPDGALVLRDASAELIRVVSGDVTRGPRLVASA